MFYVVNEEKNRIVGRFDSHYEAELKLESLEHNGKDLDNYSIVPTKEFRFEQVTDTEVLYTHIYKIPYVDEYTLEVQKVIDNCQSKFRSRLIKKDYGIISDLDEMTVFSGGVNGKYNKTFYNPHPLSEEEYVAMIMNQIYAHIECMEEDIDWLEQMPL